MLLSNQHAWELFELLAGQVIVAGMGDILGIKFEAIEFIFNLYQIDEAWYRQDLFEKIIVIDSIRLGNMRDEMRKNINKPKSGKK